MGDGGAEEVAWVFCDGDAAMAGMGENKYGIWLGDCS
jgi:hypothetical protein